MTGSAEPTLVLPEVPGLRLQFGAALHQVRPWWWLCGWVVAVAMATAFATVVIGCVSDAPLIRATACVAEGSGRRLQRAARVARVVEVVADVEYVE